jgi:hypothetical protein
MGVTTPRRQTPAQVRKAYAAKRNASGTNVQLKSGRGVVHAAHPGAENPFPACRTGAENNQTTSRYGHTTLGVNCDKCLEAAEQLPAAPREPRRAPKVSPRASRSRRNGTAQDEANTQATTIIADETEKVIAKRSEPTDARKPGCSDEDYALAVKVKELRAQGRAWWSIGHELGLKGSGPSVKQGKTGAAHARRLWEKAWGATYKDTSVPRETKAIKTERALTQPGKPFFSADTPDLEVLDAVKGKSIEWTTRLGAGDTVVCSIQTAIVGDKAQVVQGLKGRVLKFYELPESGSRLSGPLRSVYVQQIEKVGL